jgi:hypothetical protein
VYLESLLAAGQAHIDHLEEKAAKAIAEFTRQAFFLARRRSHQAKNVALH